MPSVDRAACLWTAGANGPEYSSAWLGIDGDESNDVMQAGTTTDSDGNSFAWLERFPACSVSISNFPVNPGDAISLLLRSTSKTTAWITIGNLTSGQYANFAVSAPAVTSLVDNWAEAIVERPGVNGAVVEPPRYGEVFFDDTIAIYSAGGAICPIGLVTPISMLAHNGVTVFLPRL